LALGDTDTRIARTALGALGELDGRAALPVLARYRTAADFGIRFRALSLLIRFGDADALDEVARIVSAAPFTREFPQSWFYNEKEEPLMTAYGDLQAALGSYGGQSVDGSTAPDHVTERFVDGVGRLAQVNNRKIRREAIHALRGLNRRASFPILAAALDDPDEHVRYDSMFTLCMAMEAPDLGCPATFLFEKDEQKYINRVRMWWSTQKP
jgi:HEAT repeat protein